MKKRLGAFVGAGLLLVARGSRSWLRGHETKSIAPPDDHVDVLESWLPDISAPRVPAKTEAPSAVVSEPEKIPETATGQRPAAADKPRSPISTVSGTCGKEVFVALDASYYVTEAVLRTALAAEDRECIEPTIQVGTIKIAAEATDEGFQSKEAAAEHNAKISGLQVARFATKLDIDTVLRLFFLNSDPRNGKTAIFPTLKDDAQAAFEAREMVQLTLREDLRLKKLQTPAASPGTEPQVQGDSKDSDSNIVQVIVDSGFAEVPRHLEFVLAPPSEQNFQEKASVQQALVLVEKQGAYGDAVGYVWNEVNKRKFENLITKTVDVFLESEAAAAEEEKKQEEAALAAAADAAQEVESGGTAGSTGGGAPAGSAAGGGANSTTATAAGGAGASGKANKASLVEVGVKNKMKTALVPPPTSSSFSAPNLISGGRGRKIENGGGAALQSVRGGTATSTTSGQKKQVPSSTAIEESSSVARSAGAQSTNTRDDGPSIQRRTEPQNKDQNHHVPESAYWPILEIAGFAVLADLLLLICCNDPATSYRRGSSSSSRDYFYLHGNTDRSSNVSTGLPSGSGSNRSGNNNNNWRRGAVESSKGTTMVEASVQTSSSAEEQSEPSGRRGEPETVNPEQSRGSA